MSVLIIGNVLNVKMDGIRVPDMETALELLQEAPEASFTVIACPETVKALYKAGPKGKGIREVLVKIPNLSFCPEVTEPPPFPIHPYTDEREITDYLNS